MSVPDTLPLATGPGTPGTVPGSVQRRRKGDGPPATRLSPPGLDSVPGVRSVGGCERPILSILVGIFGHATRTSGFLPVPSTSVFGSVLRTRPEWVVHGGGFPVSTGEGSGSGSFTRTGAGEAEGSGASLGVSGADACPVVDAGRQLKLLVTRTQAQHPSRERLRRPRPRRLPGVPAPRVEPRVVDEVPHAPRPETSEPSGTADSATPRPAPPSRAAHWGPPPSPPESARAAREGRKQAEARRTRALSPLRRPSGASRSARATPNSRDVPGP